jgi:hypothetical protein
MNYSKILGTIKSFAVTFFRSDYGIAFTLAVAWQLIMTIFGIVVDNSFESFRNPDRSYGESLLSHMNQWDAGWYQGIIETPYSSSVSPAQPAFYPLFPLLVTIVKFLSFGSLGNLDAGLLLNTIALGFILVALMRIVRQFTPRPQAPYFAVALFLAAPAAFFLHTFYSEAVFIAIGAWAYLFALQRKWMWVGIALAVLTAARLPSVLFIALCGLEFLRAYGWKIKAAFNKNLFWFFLAPIGFLLYGLYLHISRGDFLAMFHAYGSTLDWTYHVFNPNIFQTIGRSIKVVLLSFGDASFDTGVVVNHLLPVVSIGAIFLLSIYAIFRFKGRGIPLGIFGLLSIIMFALNNNIVSVHRYALCSLVIFVMAAIIVSSAKRFRLLGYILIYASVLTQAYLYILFVCGHFAG